MGNISDEEVEKVKIYILLSICLFIQLNAQLIAPKEF
jgi:hypothetical protein